MLSPKRRAVNTARTPLKTYHPANAPDRTACVVYVDPVLGLVACSHRSTLGIMRISVSINFDAGVFECLQADGVKWIEVLVRDIKITYRVTLDDMATYGQRQQRCGLQIALPLKYWAVDMPAAQPAPGASEAQPVAAQLDLFGGNS